MSAKERKNNKQNGKAAKKKRTEKLEQSQKEVSAIHLVKLNYNMPIDCGKDNNPTCMNLHTLTNIKRQVSEQIGGII